MAARVAVWSQKYGANHLSVIAQQTQMRELQRSIQDEMLKIEQSYKSDYEIALAREQSLQAASAPPYPKRRSQIRPKFSCGNWKAPPRPRSRSTTISCSATLRRSNNNPSRSPRHASLAPPTHPYRRAIRRRRSCCCSRSLAAGCSASGSARCARPSTGCSVQAIKSKRNCKSAVSRCCRLSNPRRDRTWPDPATATPCRRSPRLRCSCARKRCSISSWISRSHSSAKPCAPSRSRAISAGY